MHDLNLQLAKIYILLLSKFFIIKALKIPRSRHESLTQEMK